MSDRITHPLMEYYRHIYKDSPRWDGKTAGRLLVYCEQGYGDQIMFLRFVPKGAILHAPKALERLIRHMGFDFFNKEDPDLPPHDFHVLSMDLPFVMQRGIPLETYIHVEEKFDLPKGINIGITWEGKTHRCPLKYFKRLEGNLISLTPRVTDYSLTEECEDLEVLGVKLADFYDTAKLINSVDYVISVDTAVLHLSGAMGKKTYGLLSDKPDSRWDYSWYPSVTTIRKGWEESLEEVKNVQSKQAAHTANS